MKTMIEGIINTLKEKTKRNLFQIQNIQNDIRKLLMNPESDERTAKIEEKYLHNKVLLEENNDFIILQKTLSEFVEKYNNSALLNKPTSPAKFKNEKECFKFTVSNQIPFNEEHPYFDNESFFQKLLFYYQNKEDYEKCDMLLKKKHSHKPLGNQTT